MRDDGDLKCVVMKSWLGRECRGVGGYWFCHSNSTNYSLPGDVLQETWNS